VKSGAPLLEPIAVLARRQMGTGYNTQPGSEAHANRTGSMDAGAARGRNQIVPGGEHQN